MKNELIQILDPQGNCDETAIADLTKTDFSKMYRLMLLTRLWNEKALSLQRQGRLGTFGSVRGQEAANIGMALALKPNDWFIPSFREFGAQFALGIPLRDQYFLWGGFERGNYVAPPLRVTPNAITVGSHLPHAVGVALAAKIKGEKCAVLSSSGDGSTSQGAFHEGLNFAAVYQAPVVFVIQNNHWAISLPVEKQTATKTIAEKAAAYGMAGARVDGNDVFAVYKTVKKFTDIARDQFKPALIELVTYRMDDHTTADDASRYRDPAIVKDWQEKDPILRMQIYLTQRHGWTEMNHKDLVAGCSREVEQAVQEYEAEAAPEPTGMFENMYHEMPWHLQKQQAEVRARTTEGGR
jgi:pyruvate dehydrogenase E1 component alpha subunit